MIDVETAFACFAEKKVVGRSKVDQMIDLLPHIAKAVGNGYLLFEVLEKASDVIGCKDLQRSSLYALYFRALKKVAKNGAVQPSTAQSIQIASIAAPTPESTQPAPAEKPAAPAAAATSSALTEEQKRETERERNRGLYAADNAAARARQEVLLKLQALGDQAGDWGEARWGEMADVNEKEAYKQWLLEEAGRREMISEMVRIAYRGRQSERADDKEYSDGALAYFLNKGERSLEKRIFSAKARRVKAAELAARAGAF